MDPYLENGEWADFHTSAVVAFRDALTPWLRGRYVARIEHREPIPEEHREAFLVIRGREGHEVVTVLEILSPANKRSSSDGRAEYLAKREAILRSQTDLVELDLLRGGERLPVLGPAPPGDFYAIVSRAPRRPRAEIYAWTLRDALPRIPVPLRGDDPDVAIDLPTIFATLYERARYDLTLDYEAVLAPSLAEGDAAWARERIAAAS
jgi:hypothetical protein